MRPIALLGLTLLLYGCASAPSQERGAVVVRWHMASLAEVNEICNAGMPAKHRKSVWGCYRRTFDQCTVCTASSHSHEDPRLHDTLGHEVRHCFQGARSTDSDRPCGGTAYGLRYTASSDLQ